VRRITPGGSDWRANDPGRQPLIGFVIQFSNSKNIPDAASRSRGRYARDLHLSLAPSEDDWIICGKWPEKDRWALREMIDSLPLHEEPICDECLRNFWRRIVEQPDSRSKH